MIFSIIQRGYQRPCFLKTKHMAGMKKVIKEKERWLVDYNQNTMCRLEKGARLYTGAGDGLFGSFEEAQSYLFAILRHKQAQAIADIERLSAELKVIEAKINTIHLSKKK